MIQKSLFGESDEGQAEQGNPKFRPRPYQQRGLAKAWEEYDRGTRGMLCRQATGTGKTVTASLLIKEWLRRDPRRNRAMVMADQRELVWQFADEIRDVTGIAPRIEMGDRRVYRAEDPEIVVACRQSLQERVVGGERASRLYSFDNTLNWLLIPDEAHRWSPKLKSVRHIIDWFGHNPNSFWFGITATPYRSDGVSLAKMFPVPVLDYPLLTLSLDGESVPPPCAISDGWAVPYAQKFIRLRGVDFTKLDVVAGDWQDDQLQEVLIEQERIVGMCDPMLDIVGERRTLIFSPGVDMARRVSAYLNAKADRTVCRWLDGSIPDETRRDVYRAHKNGEFQFLSVCGLCREGYNDPGIGAVAVFRPTKSQSLGEQMKGRGGRPIERLDHLATAEERIAAIAASAKPNCIIIDLVGVSNMPEGATTAQIYASAINEEDREEVVRRTNIALTQAPEGQEADVVSAIKKAREELAAERAAARAEREERLRIEQEEFKKRIALGARANYTVTDVNGASGVVRRDGRLIVLATPKQQGFMRRHGIEFDPSVVTKGMASRVIGQIRGGMSAEEVQRKNRLFQKKNSGPAAKARTTPAPAAPVRSAAIENANRAVAESASQRESVDLSEVFRTLRGEE